MAEIVEIYGDRAVLRAEQGLVDLQCFPIAAFRLGELALELEDSPQVTKTGSDVRMPLAEDLPVQRKSLPDQRLGLVHPVQRNKEVRQVVQINRDAGMGVAERLALGRESAPKQ